MSTLLLLRWILFEAGNALTGPNQLTTNDLYHEMTKLQLELSPTAMGEDPDVRNLAKSLREKFDQYWRGCFLVLAVAVVMDPRFKMHLIKFTFNKSYGADAEKWTKSVDDAVHDLYLNYSEQNLLDAYVDHGFSEIEVAQESHFHQDMAEDANTGNGQSGDETSPQVEETTESHQHERQLKAEKQNVVGLWEGVSEESQLTEEDQQHGDDSQADAMAEEDYPSFPVDVLLEEGSTLITIGESLSDFEMYMSDMKTELDQYLEENLIPRSEDFNVLSWWRVNSTNYPTLSKMAADLLSVPFSTVSPDSVFDTEVKQMDNYRTSLPGETLEALLCTKDWFKNGTL
ncbi:hAT-like transposase RNase-H fold [Arabidopsis thaliana x Arabidopsis arenosa]|uniref:HAT-like transposase RNase-H fold n=1 Tax=Arabidopsis thaliana x Arabidopsis arenosa TaxID=1240361 RepID=A0A8T2C3R8_9BRAS|nr:hAT-like transposase RNase-H fold [Arabidopsis thaliana x Arabidopsis arenosa]